jgi:hypothetical protein
MNQKEMKDAIRMAIRDHIPFDRPEAIEYAFLAEMLVEIAAEMGYVRRLPHCFRDRTWAFHVSPEKGLRWGYVKNNDKIGWFEGRESTPLPERDRVIKDAEPVFGLRSDLL